eukprot:12931213-Prorocentrum_lima.AAC.1
MQLRQVTEVIMTPSPMEEWARLVASIRAMINEESEESYSLLKQSIEAVSQELVRVTYIIASAVQGLAQYASHQKRSI